MIEGIVMTKAEQQRIIHDLRSKAPKIRFAVTPRHNGKFDKQAVWKKAQKAGKTIHDDDLPAAHPTRA